MTTQSYVYRVTFLEHDNARELYARYIAEDNMLGFVELEDLIFPDQTRLLVDPAQDQLRQEFSGVRRTYLPMHVVLRIDQLLEADIYSDQRQVGETVRSFPAKRSTRITMRQTER